MLEDSIFDPISVENIKLNCLTSVQLLVPEIGSFIPNSIIKFLRPSKSFFNKHLFNSLDVFLILSELLITLLFVFIN